MARVLIVDDEQDVVEFLVYALEPEGWELGRAYNGVEAVLAVLDSDWDAVLMDVRMPELNGINALKIIRHIAPDLPVVIFTGQASEDHMQKATKIGAFACLIKPVCLQTLFEIVHKAMVSSSKEPLLVMDRPRLR